MRLSLYDMRKHCWHSVHGPNDTYGEERGGFTLCLLDSSSFVISPVKKKTFLGGLKDPNDGLFYNFVINLWGNPTVLKQKTNLDNCRYPN